MIMRECCVFGSSWISVEVVKEGGGEHGEEEKKGEGGSVGITGHIGT
jgi:hypothetical protein